MCCKIWVNILKYFQSWEFAHLLILLIAHSLISLKSNEPLWAIHSDCSWQMSNHERIAQVAQFKMSNVSESLISLTKNERPWAIRSGCSEEMSDRERIAQVAHQKLANEWIAHFFEQMAHLLIFGQKTSGSLGNQMSEFPALNISFKKRFLGFLAHF